MTTLFYQISKERPLYSHFCTFWPNVLIKHDWRESRSSVTTLTCLFINNFCDVHPSGRWRRPSQCCVTFCRTVRSGKDRRQHENRVQNGWSPWHDGSSVVILAVCWKSCCSSFRRSYSNSDSTYARLAGTKNDRSVNVQILCRSLTSSLTTTPMIQRCFTTSHVWFWLKDPRGAEITYYILL